MASRGNAGQDNQELVGAGVANDVPFELCIHYFRPYGSATDAGPIEDPDSGCLNDYDEGTAPIPWEDFESCQAEADYCAEHEDTLMVHCALTCGTCAAPAAGSCADVVGWADSDGDRCPAYTTCEAGTASRPAAYYERWAVDGISAAEACCSCGGGATTGGGGGAGGNNLVQTLSGMEEFSTLVTAVQAAGLVDALSAAGEFTVFAPTSK